MPCRSLSAAAKAGRTKASPANPKWSTDVRFDGRSRLKSGHHARSEMSWKTISCACVFVAQRVVRKVRSIPIDVCFLAEKLEAFPLDVCFSRSDLNNSKCSVRNCAGFHLFRILVVARAHDARGIKNFVGASRHDEIFASYCSIARPIIRISELSRAVPADSGSQCAGPAGAATGRSIAAGRYSHRTRDPATPRTLGRA